MEYVFCPSYGSVFFALSLKNSGQEVDIITDNASIKKFCDFANLPCFYFDYINIPTLKPHKIFVLQKILNNFFHGLNIAKTDSFYLLDNGFDISGFYLARLWSRKGVVYFHNLGRSFDRYQEKLNLSFVARTALRYLLKGFLGLDLTFINAHGMPAWGIDEKFISKNKIKKLSLDKSLKELQYEAMLKSPIKLSPHDNLIATDGSVYGIISQASLTKVYQGILALPFKFIVKNHPQVLTTERNEYEAVFSRLEEAPDYLPVELLLPNIRKTVISVCSISLVSASQLDNLKPISILELVDWESESYKKEVKEWLTKESHSRITFVESIEELSELLRSSN